MRIILSQMVPSGRDLLDLALTLSQWVLSLPWNTEVCVGISSSSSLKGI